MIDGRDIGTVVCPARRLQSCSWMPARKRGRIGAGWSSKRWGRPSKRPTVLADIRSRDARDSQRAVAPLKPAADAALLDTTDLDIDAAFAAALALVKPKVEEALEARPRG